MSTIDIFVAKIDSDGIWQWAVQVGGSGNDSGNSIAIDSSNNYLYITGSFSNTVTFGSTTLTSLGGTDIFVAKIDAYGNWIWAVSVGGSSTDSGQSIAVDNNNDIYVTGSFTGTVTFGTTTLVSGGFTDIFVAKIDNTGNWIWAISAGGTGNDIGQGITIDSNNNSYVTGTFSNSATFGSFTLVSSGNTDIFVAKIDDNGNWIWVTKAGSISVDTSKNIIVDNQFNCYITGDFSGNATFGSTILNSYGITDIFIAKIDSSGNWVWAKRAGGTGSDSGQSITIYNNDLYITGNFSGTVIFGSKTLTSLGNTDIFVAKMDMNGNWSWVISNGNINPDTGQSIIFDIYGNCYITGNFSSNITFESTTLFSSGSSDMFITKTFFIDGLIVVANESNLVNNLINVSWSGIINSFTGLTVGKLYYYKPQSKIPTTIPTSYKLGYAISTTAILYVPSPQYYPITW